MFRIVIVPPDKLQPCEMRRIILEAYHPPSSSSSSCNPPQRYIELGSVSNFGDYTSRTFGTTMISSSPGLDVMMMMDLDGGKSEYMKKEYVHVVHGTFCNVGSVLSWLCQNNMTTIVQPATNDDYNDKEEKAANDVRTVHDKSFSVASPQTKISRKKKSDSQQQQVLFNNNGVCIPLHLARFMMNANISFQQKFTTNKSRVSAASASFYFLPFQRRLIRNSNGKMIVKEPSNFIRQRKHNMTPRVEKYHSYSCEGHMKKTADKNQLSLSFTGVDADDGCCRGMHENKIGDNHQEKTTTWQYSPEREAKADVVRAEALSDPFSYMLPFFV